MVITDMCEPTVGEMARQTRVMRYCNVKLTLSWRFKVDHHSLKPGLFVDADSVSHESKRKSLS